MKLMLDDLRADNECQLVEWWTVALHDLSSPWMPPNIDIETPETWKLADRSHAWQGCMFQLPIAQPGGSVCQSNIQYDGRDCAGVLCAYMHDTVYCLVNNQYISKWPIYWMCSGCKLVCQRTMPAVIRMLVAIHPHVPQILRHSLAVSVMYIWTFSFCKWMRVRCWPSQYVAVWAPRAPEDFDHPILQECGDYPG